MINDFIEIAKLIAKFQSIETALKVILVQSQMEEDKKNNKLKDSYSLAEVDELLRRYAKVSRNQELFDRLSVLKDYRNFLAHKSLLSVSNMPKSTKEFIRCLHTTTFELSNTKSGVR